MAIELNKSPEPGSKSSQIYEIGRNVVAAKKQGKGPDIWLAGDPADLEKWMPLGIAGVVTNTVVLNQMVKKYGHIRDVTQRYLDITDKPVVIEIDGATTGELIKSAEYFCEMSDRIIIKYHVLLNL